ncbi:MAG: carbohydrate kinase family protein [Desulfurococcales archaeon]|nr:carbohydrate kinase family protein [Desulfurococcales archaeon]
MRGALILGDLCLDIDVEQGERRGSQIEARRIRLCPAGSGGNVAITMASLGLEAVIASPVSRDPVFSLLGSMLARLTGPRVVELWGSGGTCTIINVYRAGRPRRVLYHPGPRASLRGYVEALELEASRLGHVHLTGYLLELVPHAEIQELLDRGRGYSASIDLHPRAGLLGAPLRSLLGRVDYVFGTLTEIASLLGSIREAADKLISSGVKCMVVKLGSRGARAYCRDGTYSYKPQPVRPVMLKGAGDVFVATFLASLAMRKSHEASLEEAVRESARHVAGQGPLNKAWDSIAGGVA